jgi:hypothetical protein
MKINSSIRVQNLAKILLTKYIPAEQINRKFSSHELKNTFDEKVFLETYKNLGGLQPFPELTFEVPFLEFGRFCVLLDEPIHFNRYRAKTLRSSFYESLSSFPAMKYRTYSRNYESECLKVGASKPLWTNTEAELHFGPSQLSGDLGLSGASGWKMIALNDYTTDLICRKRKIRLLRLSVWDDLMVQNNLKRINELLMSPGTQATEQILKLVDRKMIGLYADDF